MIFVAILLLIAGFVALVKGADVFVDGAAALAGKFGIPQLVIGLTIVAMGTSLPGGGSQHHCRNKGQCGDYSRQYCRQQYTKYPYNPGSDRTHHKCSHTKNHLQIRDTVHASYHGGASRDGNDRQ